MLYLPKADPPRLKNFEHGNSCFVHLVTDSSEVIRLLMGRHRPEGPGVGSGIVFCLDTVLVLGLPPLPDLCLLFVGDLPVDLVFLDWAFDLGFLFASWALIALTI